MTGSEHLAVLIIDDDTGTRTSLRRILKLDGYSVDEADTAASAFERNNWSTYFAILLDRNLPDGNADELLPRLRRVAPKASILIVTGNADLRSTIAALRHGAADYLLKPVEPESLRARLRGLASLRVAQEELARRDAELKFMVEHLPAAAAYVDHRSHQVRFNLVIEEITGYHPDEMATVDDCFDRLFGTDAEIIREQYQANSHAWQDGPTRLRIHRKDGVERAVEFRGYRYDDHEVWMLHDVTERDRHETELRIRNQAIQSANEGVVIADASSDDYAVVFANKAFERISGLTANEAVGQNCELICGRNPDSEALSTLRAALARREESCSTVQCFRSDGRPFWNEISIAPVRSTDGIVTHIVAVMEDVSERRHAQQKLLQSERLAAIGEMMTGLAHESRNALQRAQACLDMLTLDLEDQPDELQMTDKIRRALQDLHRHYEEVRNYAAPINLQCRPTDLVKLWRNTWKDLEPVRSGCQIDLVESGKLQDPICEIDEHRIEQVFRNIMENAIAACTAPGQLTIQCTMFNQKESEFLRISFHDNGPGFGDQSAARVFQPFYTTKQKGTGLGMAITKRIVDAHGGSIEIVDSHSVGAEVIVTLPRQFHKSQSEP